MVFFFFQFFLGKKIYLFFLCVIDVNFDFDLIYYYYLSKLQKLLIKYADNYNYTFKLTIIVKIAPTNNKNWILQLRQMLLSI